MPNDAELLRRYAEERSESAFAELVQRHLNLVYGVALRQVGGDAHLAQDVAQKVFTALACKSRALAGRPVLAGWLYRSTQFAAADVVRAERRRRARELEAHTMQENSTPVPSAADWEKIRPVLDEVIAELEDRDRDVVLLRFFEGRAFAEIGATLRVSEDAARMRAGRALDKMHASLNRRGVTSTTAALATFLANQTLVAAPAGLAATVTGAALAGAGAMAGVGAWATFMSMTKLQLGIASVLAVAGATGVVLQAQGNAQLRAEATSLRQENAAIAPLVQENAKLARTAAEVADLRGDDAELARLRDESAALQHRLQQVAAAQGAAAGPKRTGEVLDVSKLDQVPRVKSQVRPRYPADMRKAGISGEVLVNFVVDREGRVQNAFAAKSSQREFESAAVEAVSQWTFSAGLKGGRAVNTHLVVPITFSLDRNEGTPGTPSLSTGAAKPSPKN